MTEFAYLCVVTHELLLKHKNISSSNILGFHGGHYEMYRLLGYNNRFRTSQETRHVSATGPSRLILCKIWGFQGGDYEECRLLWYKNRVLTSQETLYISATEPSQLMLCKIWGYHGGDYEECRLLGYWNPVRTSQESHYISAAEPRRLMLCKIWSFQDRTLRRVALMGTDVAEEHIASNISVTRIGELGTTLAVSSKCLRSVLQ
jgi:hypothetical protein